MNEKVILSVENLSKNFAGVRALNGVNCRVKKGQIHGLIGPNGSGKTTFFNVVTGVLPTSEGRIYFESRDITNLKAHAISKLGISRTFQGGLVVPSMNCLENVIAGAHGRTRVDVRGTFFHLPFTNSAQEKNLRNRAMEFLKMVGLAGFEQRWASDLVWVERQQLQIARALAAEPRLLLLDEPTAGMGEEESARVVEIVQHVRGMGVTIILVSHDVKVVIGLSDWITVLNSGQKIFEGTPEEVQLNPSVLEAYLGAE